MTIHASASPSAPVRPPTRHWNYDELDNCPCHLCVGYRRLGAEARTLRQDEASTKLACSSPEPPERRFTPVSIAFLAQSNRRDLYSELSYLTQDERWAPAFLEWVLDRIENQAWHSESWWAWRSQDRTLGEWIDEWQDERQDGQIEDAVVAHVTRQPDGFKPWVADFWTPMRRQAARRLEKRGGLVRVRRPTGAGWTLPAAA